MTTTVNYGGSNPKSGGSEEVYKVLGFESAQEFYAMVAAVDLSIAEKQNAFNNWKKNDGTKNGLIKLSEPKTELTGE